MTARLSFLTTALGLVLAIGPTRAADACKYLPANTEIAFTINIKQILEAPLVQKHFLDKAKSELQNNKGVQEALVAIGFNPFLDFSRVVGAMPAFENNTDRIVFVVEGKFDPVKIEAVADKVATDEPGKLVVHKAGAAKVYEVKDAWENKKPLFASLIDGASVVVSPTRDYVTEALERKSSPEDLKKDIRSLVENTDNKESFSVVVLSSGLGKNVVPNGNDKAAALLAKIVNVLGGVTIGEDVNININVACKDAAAAMEIRQTIAVGLTFVTAMAAGNPELGPLAEILATVKVAPKGSAVQVRALISKDICEKAIKQLPK